MKKISRVGIVYELIIGILGIAIPLYLAIKGGIVHPPVLHWIFFGIFALWLAHTYITFGNTIVSFEILIYYFLFYKYGYVNAAITAFAVIFLLWGYYSIRALKVSKRESFYYLKRGLFNAGSYGLIFTFTGWWVSLIKTNIDVFIGLTIVSLVLLNELLIFIDTWLYGEDLKHFKTWNYWKSSFIEGVIYSVGVSFGDLYQYKGLLSTFPILMVTLLLSYFGRSANITSQRLLKRLSYLREMNRILRILSSILDLDTLLESIVKQTFRFFGAKFVTLCISDEDVGIYRVYYDGEKVSTEKDGKPCIPHNSTIISKETKEIVFPIPKGGGVLGEMRLLLTEIDDEKIGFIDVLGKNIGISITNALLHRMSIEDSLTGLYTRRFFDKRLREEFNRSERSGEPLSLLMFDLNDFKLLNDTYGHDAGDMALIMFTGYLKKYTRTYDTAARWGGDEFMVLLPRTNRSEAEAFMQRILKETRNTTIEFDGKEIKISASAGIAEYDPKSNPDMTPEKLISIADRNLLNSKKQNL